ncbi:MAG: hypothetical protein ACOC56_01295 [Atribacterota bacterium]
MKRSKFIISLGRNDYFYDGKNFKYRVNYKNKVSKLKNIKTINFVNKLIRELNK